MGLRGQPVFVLMSEINWYPGHMAKTRRELEKQLSLTDCVIELIDARAPYSTRNPDLARLTGHKARILVLNKADLADDAATQGWLEYFKRQGVQALKFRSTGDRPQTIIKHVETALEDKVARMKAKGVNKTLRVMIVGIPNVGKSTFINRIKGQAVAKAQDRPGVTRSAQWIRITPFLELMDTPGLLWPKLSDEAGARRLAYLGSIKDDIMDTEQLAAAMLKELLQIKPEAVMERYKLKPGDEALKGEELLDACCRGRGLLLTGGRFDTLRCAALALDEFRGGKLGKITLERVSL